MLNSKFDRHGNQYEIRIVDAKGRYTTLQFLDRIDFLNVLETLKQPSNTIFTICGHSNTDITNVDRYNII